MILAISRYESTLMPPQSALPSTVAHKHAPRTDLVIQERVRVKVTAGTGPQGPPPCLRRSEPMRDQDPDPRKWEHRELSAFRRLATLVAARGELREVYEQVAVEAAALVGAEGGSVMRLDHPGAGAAVLVGASGAHAGPRVGCALRISGGCAAARSLRDQKPARTQASKRTGTCCPTDFACHTAVAAPVRVAGQLWGVIMAANEGDGRPRPGTELILDELAHLVGLAVDNAELHDALLASARSDPLTGAANRRAFDEQLEREVHHARRDGLPLALLVMDVDHFKEVNDTSGHVAGDALLIRLAKRLKSALRRDELLARVGGDEFALILPGADTAVALRAAARLQETIAGAQDGQSTPVSLSIGVCELADAKDASVLVSRADAALYAAKRGGGATARGWTDTQEGAGSRTIARRHAVMGLRALARAIDLRDRSTQRHSERVAHVVNVLAREAGWASGRVQALTEAGLVHDVGKVAVPDAILTKPSALDPLEYATVKRHAALGAEITAEILEPEQVSWVRHHHERHDGHGYPDGLAQEGVPLGARFLALADAWDVMVTDRPYKGALSADQALAECRRQAGRQFCPYTVELLTRAAAKGALH